MKHYHTIHKEFKTAEELKDSVKCLWYNDSDFGEEETGFEVIPDGYAEIIFHFGDGCRILHHGSITELPSPFLVGLLDKPIHFYARKRLRIIAVRCFPWTVFDLLGLKANKSNVHTFEHPVAELHPALEALIDQDNIEEAIRIVNEYFTHLHAVISDQTLLYKAGKAMRKTGGIIPVHRIADASHSTVRTLERKFKQSSGHTVKDVSGVMRFEKARNYLWLNPDGNLAELAAECGYTDQAHLIKVFRRYAGTTPGKFAQKARKEKISGNDFVAFIQSPE